MKSFMIVFLALFISAHAGITYKDRENIRSYLTKLANSLRVERETIESSYFASVDKLRDGTFCVGQACDDYLRIGRKTTDSSLGEMIELFEETADDAKSEEESTLAIAKASIENGSIAKEVEVMRKALNIELGLHLKKLTARVNLCKSQQ